MSKHSLLDTIEIAGVQMDVTFRFYPGRAGRYSGPPEDCYEAEPPEWEIEKVIAVAGDNRIDITELVSENDDLYGSVIAKLETASIDNACVDYDPRDLLED